MYTCLNQGERDVSCPLALSLAVIKYLSRKDLSEPSQEVSTLWRVSSVTLEHDDAVAVAVVQSSARPPLSTSCPVWVHGCSDWNRVSMAGGGPGMHRGVSEHDLSLAGCWIDRTSSALSSSLSLSHIHFLSPPRPSILRCIAHPSFPGIPVSGTSVVRRRSHPLRAGELDSPEQQHHHLQARLPHHTWMHPGHPDRWESRAGGRFGAHREQCIGVGGECDDRREQ